MKYCAIVVLYSPDYTHVEGMVRELIAANVEVILFDNTPISPAYSEHTLLISGVIHSCGGYLLGDGNNVGLGDAFNLSVNFAKSQLGEIEAFIFFDQDSFIDQYLIKNLIGNYIFLLNSNVPVGVLGAMPRSLIASLPYKIPRCSNYLDILNKYNIASNFIPAKFVISSFSLVPTKVFDTVGLFDGGLFIDLVDSEFSFRISKYGLLNIICKDIEFPHVIGEERHVFLWKSFSVSSPLRNYYQARNLILVGIKYRWYFFIIQKIFLRFIQVILSGIYSGFLFKRIKYFFLGIFHGVIGKSGKIY